LRNGKTTHNTLPVKETRSNDTQINSSPPIVQEPIHAKQGNPAPFPQALHSSKKKKTKSEPTEKELMDLFGQVEINIPILDAIKYIPAYAKFLKDLCTPKRQPKNLGKVILPETVSSVVQSRLPLKRKDPGAPLIQVIINDTSFDHALLDLGASINLIPTVVFEEFKIGELKPVEVTLQLADRSTIKPRGIVEDVLVRVKDCLFAVDFLVLDIEVPEALKFAPIILGRPFLATARANIDCDSGKMKIMCGGESVTLDIFQASRRFQEPDFFDDSDSEIENIVEETLQISQLGSCFAVNTVPEQSTFSHPSTSTTQPANIPADPFTLTSPLTHKAETLSEPGLQLELKPLPDSLKYVFLGPNQTLPLIINSGLTGAQEHKLLQVLSKYRKAIGWTLSDLKGIHPSYCTHRIFLEDDSRPSRQPQRRLNPIMQEVVKKEIIKWLDADIIYPISDSSWVSPTQVVPKKAGLTVVTNEKGENIATRTASSWRVCIDYRKLNTATKKDHFPLPFIDQILERLAGREFYCFLDGYSGYNQVAVHPEDQDKTTFTCPFGTFAFRRMPFGLCNAPATFQRCMLAIFSDLVGECLEVFMDDFSIFGDSFDHCLKNLERTLQKCIEVNLVLSGEKSHFMVQ
jgi:hypothetical protein